MHLFRPTGQRELELVFETGMRAWPPRLPEQPIFYPVLNRGYAYEIAAGWNVKDEGLVGYVTQFDVEDEYSLRFSRKVVGSTRHEELWVPAEELPAFNAALVGQIQVVDAVYDVDFVGRRPARGPLSGLNAREQLDALLGGVVDVGVAVKENAVAIYGHWLFWMDYSSSKDMASLKETWEKVFPTLPLPSRL